MTRARAQTALCRRPHNRIAQMATAFRLWRPRPEWTPAGNQAQSGRRRRVGAFVNNLDARWVAITEVVR